jgi:hypothetical protein
MASTNNQIIINDQIPIAKYYLVIVKLEFIWNLACLREAAPAKAGIWLLEFI